MLTIAQAVAGAIGFTTAAFVAQIVLADADPVSSATGWLFRMLALVAWVFTISVWHARAQARAGERQHRQLLKRVRRLTDRMGQVETRVNELSDDRTKAAAVVTRLFKDPAPRN